MGIPALGGRGSSSLTLLAKGALAISAMAIGLGLAAGLAV
jgi:hypothetical protein